jgi:hypothetical protein
VHGPTSKKHAQSASWLSHFNTYLTSEAVLISTRKREIAKLNEYAKTNEIMDMTALGPLPCGASQIPFEAM